MVPRRDLDEVGTAPRGGVDGDVAQGTVRDSGSVLRDEHRPVRERGGHCDEGGDGDGEAQREPAHGLPPSGDTADTRGRPQEVPKTQPAVAAFGSGRWAITTSRTIASATTARIATPMACECARAPAATSAPQTTR